ncbi:MAG: hypothetical protein IE926_01045 [Micrococcales bacterium]|nr:hypothetical protein [Micrococcales bacterium]
MVFTFEAANRYPEGEQQVNTTERGPAMKKGATTTTRTGLAARWVPVTDDRGRTRMEMHWSAPVRLRPRRAA